MPAKYDYDWEILQEEQQQSGISMKKFCRERDIPYHSFKNHKYQSMKKSSCHQHRTSQT